MTTKEIEIAQKYDRTCNVSECYLGGYCCATCMYCISDRYGIYADFEHCYCSKAPKKES